MCILKSLYYNFCWVLSTLLQVEHWAVLQVGQKKRKRKEERHNMEEKKKQQQLSRLSPWWGCWPGSLPPTPPSLALTCWNIMNERKDWTPQMWRVWTLLLARGGGAEWHPSEAICNDFLLSFMKLTSAFVFAFAADCRSRSSVWLGVSPPAPLPPLSPSLRPPVPPTPPYTLRSCQHVLISLPLAQLWVWEMEWLREAREDLKLTLVWKEDVKGTGVSGRKRGEHLGKERRLQRHLFWTVEEGVRQSV